MQQIKYMLLWMCLFLFFLYSFYGRSTPIDLSNSISSTIQVEIKGAIQQPGSYSLERNSTLTMLLELAGGPSETADLSSLSMNRTLANHDMIVIPEKSEEQKISINSASSEQLQSLPGIGPSISQRIIEYREQATFQNLEDIMNVKGIGEKMFEKIKERICL